MIDDPHCWHGRGEGDPDCCLCAGSPCRTPHPKADAHDDDEAAHYVSALWAADLADEPPY